MNNTPRAEYPRPQLVRPDWLCLNGEWEFEIDNQQSGKDRGLYKDGEFTKKIIVPFSPESVLSGIGNTDFMNAVWYRRDITVPAEWLKNGKRTLLHIGACDYQTDIWVNGEWIGSHIGGYVSFSFDITDALCEGENRVVILATDNLRTSNQPSGKQCHNFHSEGCLYTRTTGIWQTVWLENVSNAYISNINYVTDIKQKMVLVTAECKNAKDKEITAVASFNGEKMGEVSGVVTGKVITLALPLKEVYLWDTKTPNLYDLTITMGEDKVESYFGVREVSWTDGIFYLNGKPTFQRLVLDQGFYPDGIITAPSDEELLGDIKRSMDMGFNGARLHQKIFEPRFLYHCDKMGYMVWGEHANWGADLKAPDVWQAFLPEWLEAVRRDCAHPSIIGWCPINETQYNQNQWFVKMLIDMTNAVDGTRPIIDASGWRHFSWSGTDLLDAHDYEQDVEIFTKHYLPLAQGENVEYPHCHEAGRISFMSEYGGIKWTDKTDEDAWGYGNAPKTEEEFIERYRGLTLSLLKNKAFSGFCYTQLTDVEQEQNGLYTYEREPKFDCKIIAEINRTPAAIEE